MSLLSKIKNNPKLKKLALLALMPKHDFRPRLWVRLLLNPFKHKRGKHSIVRYNTRLDVFPFNQFSLGNHSIIEDFSTINNGVGHVLIGNDTIIGLGNVIIGPVTIGNNVMFAQNIVVSGLNHGYEDINIPPSKQDVSCKQIIIDDEVWIGANSTITAGVTIGKHSVIGAGSVVTKNIPPFSVAVGNPAKIIKQYNEKAQIWERV
jgi:acetyltransferase-like isoleucine patch superfamily enzyme